MKLNCPFCNKEVYGITGLQEVKKFQKHLRTCRKNPNRFVSNHDGIEVTIVAKSSLSDALAIRAESGQ